MTRREQWMTCLDKEGTPLDKDKCAAYQSAFRLQSVVQAKSGPISKTAITIRPPQSLEPVGDELTKLFAMMSIKPVSTCACNSWIAKMNAWGVAGCQKNRSEILGHLTTAYHATTWLKRATAAALAVKHGLPLSLEGLLDEAIRRATSPQHQ